MRLRYPEGVRSEIDADLSLTGRVTAPVLAGTRHGAERLWTTTVRHRRQPVRLRRRIGRTARPVVARPPQTTTCRPCASTCGSSRPARFASRTTTPHRRRAPTSRSAAPTSGRSSSAARKSRAESSFSKAGATSSRAARLDFTNPVRIEPTFDIAAETQVRVPRQTYRVTLSASGTMQRLRPVFSSDPPLAAGRRGVAAAWRLATGQDADLRALQRSRPDRAAAGAGARGAHAREPDLGADRRGRRTDVRRRHVPADAARERSDAAVVALQPVGAPDDRQAHLEPRLSDVLAQHQLDERPDHPARIRSRPIASRGS